MMKLSIKNFRGLASADLELSGVTLVAGLNGSGKTSLATAASAGLQRTPAPVPGMAKTDSRQYLRDHQDRGSILLESETGKTKINYPGGPVATDGNPPQSSAMACGLLNVAAMNEKNRATYLIEIMKATPTLEDLTSAMKAVGVGDKAVESCWQKIGADGWDKTHAYALTRATELKGAWGQITGEKWGGQKALGWRPAALDAVELNPVAISAAVEKARKNLEAVLAQQAVGTAEVERLRAAASADLPVLFNLNEELSKLQEMRGNALHLLGLSSGLVEKSKTFLAELPKPGEAVLTVPCPSCGDHLIVTSKTELSLASAKNNDESENEKRKTAIQSAQISVNQTEHNEREKRKEVSDLDSRIQQVNIKIAESNRAIQAIDLAKTKLAEIKTDGSTAEQIQSAREDLAECEHILACLNQYFDATKKHQAIDSTLTMAEVLAPTGLRKTVLLNTIKSINEKIASFCQIAKWGIVSIGEDLCIYYLGRNYDLLSASEQFRARVTIQIVFSDLDGSHALIIDAADILDRPGRAGLIALLMSISKPALVTMTMNDVKDLPDLSRSGSGRSYWVSESTIKTI